MKPIREYFRGFNAQAWFWVPVIIFLVIFKKIEGPALMLLGIVILIELRKRKPRFWIPMIFMFLLYGLEAIGLLYTKHFDEGLKLMEIKAALFALPIIYALARPVSEKQVRFLLRLFAFVVISFSIVTLLRSINVYLESGDLNDLVYSKLGWYFHPTYLAAYCLFSLMIILGSPSADEYRKRPWVLWLLVCWLSCFIILLSSKAGILLLPVMLVWSCLNLVRQGVQKRNVWPWLAGVGFVVVGVLLFTPKIEKRVGEVLTSTDSVGHDDIMASGSTSMRFVAWESAIEIMLEHPFGVGSGGVTRALVEKYSEKNEIKAAEKQLNAHNQYLQTGIEHGWIGMLILILLVGIPLVQAVRARRFLAASFLFMCAANMMFESYLERQNGIVFFCVFLVIFELERANQLVKGPINEKSQI
jgi:O-antigen ligase